jgi:hypothetical protein
VNCPCLSNIRLHAKLVSFADTGMKNDQYGQATPSLPFSPLPC